MSKTKIGIIGKGNVGSALGRGLTRAGHVVLKAGKDPAAVRDAASLAEVVILAVPFGAIPDAIESAGGGLVGKPVIDVSNALDANMNLALGFTTSGGEELQKLLPHSGVVKAFNTVFAQHMDTGRIGDEQLTAFFASDHAHAKTIGLGLARDIGFDAVDAGPLRNARWLESLGYLNIQLGYPLGMGREIGFKLLHP